ncbi:UPF0280 family protein [Actibacterium sp. D379-3]
MGPQASLLPDGQRLHLHHGPIDLIIGADGGARERAFARATARFSTVLDELVAELPALRRPVGQAALTGAIAQAMQRAAAPFAPVFITPMAAVAGAVADAVLAAVAGAPGLTRAYVNNGGDVAFFLAEGTQITAAMAGGRITLCAADPYRGIATSGWRGRSQSLGIADAVSVVAGTAAAADAAATLIANAVDLPGHPAITRRPAHDLAPDSDLGARLVTTEVGRLSGAETDVALDRGAAFAQDLRHKGLIGGACLLLNGQSRTIGPMPDPEPNAERPELHHA